MSDVTDSIRSLYYDVYINFYIARPKYCFIVMYACGLTVVIKRICYVMLSPPVASLLGLLTTRHHRKVLIPHIEMLPMPLSPPLTNAGRLPPGHLPSDLTLSP